jgi:hypothetical protein
MEKINHIEQVTIAEINGLGESSSTGTMNRCVSIVEL